MQQKDLRRRTSVRQGKQIFPILLCIIICHLKFNFHVGTNSIFFIIHNLIVSKTLWPSRIIVEHCLKLLVCFRMKWKYEILVTLRLSKVRNCFGHWCVFVPLLLLFHLIYCRLCMNLDLASLISGYLGLQDGCALHLLKTWFLPPSIEICSYSRL